MTTGFSPLRLIALIITSSALLVVQQTAIAATPIKPVYFDLPQITTALNHGHQLIVQVTLRLPGPIAEQHVRETVIKLRHTLVLHLSDMDPDNLDAQALDTLADRYVLAANETLEGNRVKEALFQKFVVQTK